MVPDAPRITPRAKVAKRMRRGRDGPDRGCQHAETKGNGPMEPAENVECTQQTNFWILFYQI